MRRVPVLLSVLLAAVSISLAGPPAHAGPMCAKAWVDSAAPDVETQRFCVVWDYGAICEEDHVWVDPHVHVYAQFCYPRPVG